MNKLGEIIRKIRKAKKVTLVELAQRTGVAQASLSRIETGVMTGTIDSHQKIAEALGISISELYTGLDSREADIATGDSNKNQITLLTEQLKVEALTTNTLSKKMLPALIHLQPEAETKQEELERGNERFVMLMAGEEATVIINEKEYILKNRNTIYFDGSLPHKIKNKTNYKIEVLCVTSPGSI